MVYIILLYFYCIYIHQPLQQRTMNPQIVNLGAQTRNCARRIVDAAHWIYKSYSPHLRDYQTLIIMLCADPLLSFSRFNVFHMDRLQKQEQL